MTFTKIEVFWNVTHCSLVACSTLKMEATGSSETSVTTYHTGFVCGLFCGPACTKY
jgi:hypothetical protein